MADLRISELPVQHRADIDANDRLALADLSASESKGLRVGDLIDEGIGRLLSDGQIPGSKLVPGSVGASEIDPAVLNAPLPAGSVGTTELGTAAVTTPKLAAGSVTVDKLGLVDGTLAGAAVAARSITGNQIDFATITAANIADGAVTINALAADSVGTTALSAGAVTGAKIGSRTITGGNILTDTITNEELAPAAVTAAELAANAVTNDKLAGGVTADKLAGSIPYTKLAIGGGEIPGSCLVAGSVGDAEVNSISGAKIAADTLDAVALAPAALDRGLDKSTGAIGHSNVVAPGTRNGITYDASGHITGQTALQAVDMPIATATSPGAVQVPASSGLAASGSGVLSHLSNVAAATVSGITFNTSGHITDALALIETDLPVATATAKGAVSVPLGALQVTAGVLSHAPSGAVAGSYSKVTVDAKGHVTAGAPLTAADLPALDAAKVTTGTFDTARIADQSITQLKLANYAIAYIQEAAPPVSTITHNGMLWLQESTGQLHMWNGNSWFAIGFGRLSAENLRYCGTFDAATGLVTGVTQLGTVEGLKIGGGLPGAADNYAGVYLVCSNGGNGTGATPGITFDAGDWILCNGATGGWKRIDTLSSGTGGGGGGTAGHLDDLLDVTLTVPVSGQFLQFGATGQWVNTVLPPATAAAKGVVQLADAAAITAGTAGAVVDAAQLKAVTTASGAVTVKATAPITSSGGASPTIGIVPATTTTDGSMSTAQVTKLDGIAAGAEVNVQSDWNETVTTSDAFIKNKPAAGVSAVTATAPITSSGGLTPVIGIAAASNTTAGSMSAADVVKLAGITAGAKPNVQPDWTETSPTSDAFIRNKPASTTVADGTTTTKGVVQLSTSTASTSTTEAATPSAVKAAYDLASTASSNATAANTKATTADTNASTAKTDATAAKNLAIAALPKTGGTMTGPIVFAAAQQKASTSAAGIVQMSSATNSAVETTAATSKAVDDLRLATLPLTGGVLAGDLMVPSLNGGQLAGLRNRLINGSMRISQRYGQNTAVITANTSVFAADRWYIYSHGDKANAIRTLSAGAGYPTAIYVTGEAGNGFLAIGQMVEKDNSADMAGRLCTFSFALSRSDSHPIGIKVNYCTTEHDYGSSLAQAHYASTTTTNSMARYSTTFMMPAAATKGIRVELQIESGLSGNRSVTLTDCQLELGSNATPFERLPFGLSHMLCQRYYQKSGLDTYMTARTAASSTNNDMGATITFATPMRANPSVQLLEVWPASSITVGGIDPEGFQAYVNSVMPNTTYMIGSYSADAEL